MNLNNRIVKVYFILFYKINIEKKQYHPIVIVMISLYFVLIVFICVIAIATV